MLKDIESDHLIAALLCAALLAGIGWVALQAPPGSAELADTVALDQPQAEPFRPSSRLSDIIWIWPREPEATPEAPKLAAAAGSNGCNEMFRLAGAVDAEGRNQPLGVRIAMAAIIVIEARSREMSICALTERTTFLSTWRVAQSNPWSWTAQQFKQPSDSTRAVARVALTGQFATSRGGAMHFDGAFWDNNNWQCRPDVIWRGGTTCFYP